MAYELLPSVREARAMVQWIECPLHGQKVGVDRDGKLIGRCAICATHAAQAQAVIEAGQA